MRARKRPCACLQVSIRARSGPRVLSIVGPAGSLAAVREEVYALLAQRAGAVPVVDLVEDQGEEEPPRAPAPPPPPPATRVVLRPPASRPALPRPGGAAPSRRGLWRSRSPARGPPRVLQVLSAGHRSRLAGGPNAVDARAFRDPAARDRGPTAWLRGHVGLHALIQEQLTQHEALPGFLRRVHAVLRSLHGNTAELVIFCRSGRHRSVGLVELLRLSGVLQEDMPGTLVEFAHTEQATWPCRGFRCHECLSAVPGGDYAELRARFRAAWAAARPG